MVLEIDEVVIKRSDLQALRNGNHTAVKRLKEELDGMKLYFHNLKVEEDEVTVSITLLQDLGVIKSITLHT